MLDTVLSWKANISSLLSSLKNCKRKKHDKLGFCLPCKVTSAKGHVCIITVFQHDKACSCTVMHQEMAEEVTAWDWSLLCSITKPLFHCFCVSHKQTPIIELLHNIRSTDGELCTGQGQPLFAVGVDRLWFGAPAAANHFMSQLQWRRSCVYSQMLQLSSHGATFKDANNLSACALQGHKYSYTVQTILWVFSCLLKRSRGLHVLKIPVGQAVHIRTFLKTLNVQKEEGEPCVHCPTASWLQVWYGDGTWPWGFHSGKAPFSPTHSSTLSASLWAGTFSGGIFKELPCGSTGC